MSPTKWLSRIAVCALLFAGCASVEGPSTPGRHDTLDDTFGQYATLAMFDGTVLIDAGGEIVYERSFGQASHELDVPHNSDTRFRIASVSKDLTDAAVGVLIARGVLELEPVRVASRPDGAKLRSTKTHIRLAIRKRRRRGQPCRRAEEQPYIVVRRVEYR